MVRLYMLLFVVQIALAVAALISCLSADEDDVRGLPRFGWILIILFFPLIGSIAWFLAGRTSTAARRRRWRAGGGFPERERPRPVAPDDDPDFLRKLDGDKRDGDTSGQPSRSDQELFDKWEADLRRREEELRKREDDEGPKGTPT